MNRASEQDIGYLLSLFCDTSLSSSLPSDKAPDARRPREQRNCTLIQSDSGPR